MLPGLAFLEHLGDLFGFFTGSGLLALGQCIVVLIPLKLFLPSHRVESDVFVFKAAARLTAPASSKSFSKRLRLARAGLLASTGESTAAPPGPRGLEPKLSFRSEELA